MNAQFSKHAFDRVDERISISHEDVKYLLDSNLVVDIGKECKNNRLHRVLYSDRDKICFVAIQDTKCGTVITILPVDYHNNICWQVSDEAQILAQQINSQVRFNKQELLSPEK